MLNKKNQPSKQVKQPVKTKKLVKTKQPVKTRKVIKEEDLEEELLEEENLVTDEDIEPSELDDDLSLDEDEDMDEEGPPVEEEYMNEEAQEEEEEKDAAWDVEDDEDFLDQAETTSEHLQEATEAFQSGDAPLGARIMANVMEHVQSLVEYLGSQMSPLEQPEVKAYFQEQMEKGHIKAMLEEMNEIASTVYPDHDLTALSQSEGPPEAGELEGKDLEEQDLEEQDFLTEPESSPSQMEDETTNEILERYRNLKGKYKQLLSKKKKALVKKTAPYTKACGCMKKAADFMLDAADDEETPEHLKHGMSYHGYSLAKAYDLMADGDFEEEAPNLHEEVERELDENLEEEKMDNYVQIAGKDVHIRYDPSDNGYRYSIQPGSLSQGYASYDEALNAAREELSGEKSLTEDPEDEVEKEGEEEDEEEEELVEKTKSNGKKAPSPLVRVCSKFDKMFSEFESYSGVKID